ncbi:MAG: peptidylprolyl isomerase [Bacteroidetes bacterium]|nr:peptidylprolyl isomerase [Bacteroidota bacterium]
MLKKAFFILFLALGFNLSAQQVIDKVIAVVGKYPLLLSDFETYQIEKQKEDPNAPRCKAFEEILYSKLLLAQADRDSVEVQDAEVEQELEKRLAYYIQMFGGDESKFEAFYGKRTNVFKDEMRDDVREQLLAQKMRQRITGEIKLTPSEVRQYYNSLPQDSLPVINTELQIAHIVKMPPVNEQAKADARAAIESYRERVLKGESMSVLAALYSEDPGSAKNGGRYESVMRGVMVPEFEAVAFRLKKGEVSEVFETPYGYHFIEMIARKGETVDLRHILIAPKMSQLDVYNAKLFLDSLQKQIIEGKITFEEAAKKYSDDKETKQNGGLLINPMTGATKWENEEISQMDQNLVFVFDKMNAGDVSTPVQYNSMDGKPGYRIITIISRTDPHKINYKDDYAKLLTMATFERQRKLIREWIERRSKVTYIKIDPEYNCKFEYNWHISN